VTSTLERRDAIEAFFTAHHARLHALVRHCANAPEAAIEDACQTAWTILLRRPDVTLDERGLAWLTTVATREAWRLASTTREIPVGSYHGEGTGHQQEPGESPHPDERSAEQRALERLEHAERVAALQTLKPREREALVLHGLGHSYQEIAQLMNSSYTAVNRRLSEGRAALRRGGRGTTAATTSLPVR
jgi:RNA polymerase sigma factor (sigma-70 family)